MKVEIHVIIDIDLERVEIALCIVVSQAQTYGKVVAYKILHIWLYGKSVCIHVHIAEEAEDFKILCLELTIRSGEAELPLAFGYIEEIIDTAVVTAEIPAFEHHGDSVGFMGNVLGEIEAVFIVDHPRMAHQ